MRQEALGIRFITTLVVLLIIVALPLSANGEPFSLFNSFPFLNLTIGSSKTGSASTRAVQAFETFRQLSLAPTQAFISRRSFNTSCAFTIPLFTFTLPQKSSTELDSVDLSNQAVYTLFGTLVTIMSIAVPVVFTGIRSPTVTGRGDGSKSEDTQEILDRLMSTRPVVDLMGADTKYRIGLDSTKCFQKTICEAHRSPQNKHYGLLAVPFQILFPPPINGTSEAIIPTLQMAASVGKYSKKPCGEYFKCFFDILDLACYFRDVYRYNVAGENESDDKIINM